MSVVQPGMAVATETDTRILQSLISNRVAFATSVPCKQLAGVIELVEDSGDILHVPCNKEDEGMGLCAGAYMGGMRPCIIMQNTALGVVVNSLATLIQFYHFPLPMLISYRGEVGEKVACQVEMALHTKAILSQLHIPTYHFRHRSDAKDLDDILGHCFMSNKPVAILADAMFWGSAS